MDCRLTRPASRVLPCRNSDSLRGARVTPDRCGARHRTSLAPDNASDRKSSGANANKCHRLFFLAAAQRQHPDQWITEDSVNRARSREPAKSIGIPKLASTQQFRHQSSVTCSCLHLNSHFASKQGLAITFPSKNHPHDHQKRQDSLASRTPTIPAMASSLPIQRSSIPSAFVLLRQRCVSGRAAAATVGGRQPKRIKLCPEPNSPRPTSISYDIS